MLAESLKTTVRAAGTLLRELTGTELESAEIFQIENTDFLFPRVAAAHYRQGSLRRLVVGCDDDLALSFAESRQRSADRTDGSGSASCEEGFRILCESLHASLCRALTGMDQTRSLIVHDPERFAIRAKGGRQFYIELVTSRGRLLMLLGLASSRDEKMSRLEGFGESEKVKSRQLAESTIDFSDDVNNILDSLVNHEDDVYLRLPSKEGRQKVYHGTMIGFARGQDKIAQQRHLTLTSSCLQTAGHPLEGEKVAVIFFRRGRLLQFVSEVAGTAQMVISKALTLPLLRLTMPSKLAPGQRRESFRIVPELEIKGLVKSALILKGPGKPVQKHSAPFVLRDLSFTGARIEIHSNTMLSGFGCGREVKIAIELPHPHGEVKLLAVVHRLDLLPKKKEVPCAQIGVEFIKDARSHPGSLEKIRQYVLEQERLDLKRRTELITSW